VFYLTDKAEVILPCFPAPSVFFYNKGCRRIGTPVAQWLDHQPSGLVVSRMLVGLFYPSSARHRWPYPEKDTGSERISRTRRN